MIAWLLCALLSASALGAEVTLWHAYRGGEREALDALVEQYEAENPGAEIAALDGSQRVEELARMLGGKLTTDASRRHASEMLAAARGVRSGASGKASKGAPPVGGAS